MGSQMKVYRGETSVLAMDAMARNAKIAPEAWIG